MLIDKEQCPFPLSDELIFILTAEIQKVNNDLPVILNFRDPTYSAERGGYHPIEISISARGQILYATDFSYAGPLPYAELEKEIDFDFGLRCFQHFGQEFPLEYGRELFDLWQQNFCSYYHMDVYRVTVTDVSG